MYNRYLTKHPNLQGHVYCIAYRVRICSKLANISNLVTTYFSPPSVFLNCSQVTLGGSQNSSCQNHWPNSSNILFFHTELSFIFVDWLLTKNHWSRTPFLLFCFDVSIPQISLLHTPIYTTHECLSSIVHSQIYDYRFEA